MLLPKSRRLNLAPSAIIRLSFGPEVALIVPSEPVSRVTEIFTPVSHETSTLDWLRPLAWPDCDRASTGFVPEPSEIAIGVFAGPCFTVNCDRVMPSFRVIAVFLATVKPPRLLAGVNSTTTVSLLFVLVIFNCKALVTLLNSTVAFAAMEERSTVISLALPCGLKVSPPKLASTIVNTWFARTGSVPAANRPPNTGSLDANASCSVDIKSMDSVI